MLRARPIASISSMKTMHGAFSLACLNRSRTLDAPTPTNISTKSEPAIEKNGTSASPATAFANRVLPVPGGPTSKAPFGIFPPSSVYFFGFFRKSTISFNSTLASARPATSLKVTFIRLFSASFAVDFPTLKMPPGPPPPAPALLLKPLNMKNQSTRMSSGKMNQLSMPHMSRFCSITTLTGVLPCSLREVFISSKAVSGSNLSETRKTICGGLFGTLPPKREEYFSRLSAFI